MNKPNLFLIGAPRCATTYIFSIFQNSSYIFTPLIKEPMFFAYHKNPDVVWDPSGYTSLPPYAKDIGEYLSLYDETDTSEYRLDASTHYLFRSQAAQEIFSFNPKARCIVILRDPFDRAISHYRLNRRVGREPCNSFYEALELEEKRRALNWRFDYYYASLGMYSDQLRPYLQRFEDRIKILLYRDLIEDRRSTISELFNFLGLPVPNEIPDSKYNRSLGYRATNLAFHFRNNHILQRLPRPITQVVKPTISKAFRYFLRGFDKVSQYLNYHNEMEQEASKRYLKTVLEGESKRTADIIDADLSHWSV